MARAIKQRDSALEDIAGIHDFISRGIPSSADPVAADRVLDAIEQTYKMIAEFPHRSQLPDRDQFMVPVNGFKQYLIIYLRI